MAPTTRPIGISLAFAVEPATLDGARHDVAAFRSRNPAPGRSWRFMELRVGRRGVVLIGVVVAAAADGGKAG
jgi:hypothetical protein